MNKTTLNLVCLFFIKITSFLENISNLKYPMAFNPNPSSLPLIKEDRTQILNATLSFLSTNPCTFFPLSYPSNFFIKAIKTHSLHGNLLANLLNASPVDFPMNASDNKPPALTPWFSSFKKPGILSFIFPYSLKDPLTDRQNGTENNQIKRKSIKSPHI